MRSKLLFLMLVAGLLGLSATARAGVNWMSNPSFELDENGEVNLNPRPIGAPGGGGDVLDWMTWDTPERVKLAFSDHPFGSALQCNMGTTPHVGNNWACSIGANTPDGVVAEADTVYYLECDIKSLSGPGAIAGLVVEENQTWSFDVEKLIETPDSGWGRFFLEIDTSVHTNLVGKGFLIGIRSEENLEDNVTGGSSLVAVTNIYFGIGRRPIIPVHSPTPRDGAKGVSPVTNELSWRQDVIGGKAPKVELYWGKQDDPNFWYVPGEAEKIMDLADVNSFDLSDVGAYSPSYTGPKPIVLSAGNYYYWAAKYEDPNDGFWGVPELVTHYTWSFDTINQPPVVDAGLHYDMWMESGDPAVTMSIDATVTDDGNPIGGNRTYSWTETLSNGATSPSWPDGKTVEDPNVIFPTAGDYELTLTVHDDFGGSEDEVGTDSTLIRIISNSDDRLRAHYELNGDVLDSEESHDGTIHDDPTYDTGQVGLAIELDGTDDVESDGFGDFVSIDDTGSDPNWESDTWENSDLIDGMTVYAWMKLDADGWSKAWESIVAKSTDSWELLRSGGESDDAGFSIKGGIGSAASSGVDVTSGWHQVVGVYDRNTVKFYVDGLETESANAGSVDLSPEAQEETPTYTDKDWQIPKSAGKILLGNSNNPSLDSTLNLTFGGLIDQVRIYDAAVPHRAEHSGTPGIVELYRADGGHVNCGTERVDGDQNGDCYVTLADFALVFIDWMDCSDVANADCSY